MTSSTSTTGNNDENFILFTAVFGIKYCGQGCAENGADSNILDSEPVRRINSADIDVEAETLDKARVFDMATVNTDGAVVKLSYTKSASMDTELHIPHQSTLRLRNLKWVVTDQRVTYTLSSQPILEVLGLNTRRLPAAAADQFCGCVDANRLIG